MGLLDNEYVNKLADVLYNDPKRYWVTEPEKVGYKAFEDASARYGNSGEWTKADAAKHMAWQGELAKRTMLPKALAVPVANAIGVGKEALIDGLGSALLSYKNGSPVDTWKNSLMDIRNNYVGASQLMDEPDISAAAVKKAGQSTGNALTSLLNGLPYASK